MDRGLARMGKIRLKSAVIAIILLGCSLSPLYLSINVSIADSYGYASIGSSGGTVSTADGTISITFAAGAFDTATTVSVITTTSCHSSEGNFIVGSTCFTVTPSGDLGADAYICVILNTSDKSIVSDLGDLTLGYWDNGSWREAGNVEIIGDTICCTTTHLSDWAVLGTTVHRTPTPTPTPIVTPTLTTTLSYLDNGLVAYYPFNGNADDGSGNGHDGTVYGATLTEDRFGNANSAYSFNGVNNYVQVPYSADFDVNITTGFTVSVWFNARLNQSLIYDIIDKSHGSNGAIDDHTGWVLQGWVTGGEGPATFGVGNGNGWNYVGVGSSILDNQWHQLSATYVGADMRLYLDGDLVNSSSFIQPPASNTRDLFIGRHYALGRYFNGSIDDVRIYGRALSASEVKDLFGDYGVSQSSYPSKFRDAIPLPDEVSTEPEVIGTNALYALLMVLAFYLTATIFNSTVRENYDTMRGWFKRRSKSPGRGAKAVSRDKTYKARSTTFEFLITLLAVIVTAVLYSFMDPYFTHGLSFLGVFISLVVAIGVVTFLYEGIQIILIKYRLEIPTTFRIRPIALVVAVIFVLVSWLVDFHPGLTLGFVGAYVTLSARGRFTKGQRAIPILISAIFLLAVAIVAFFVRMPVHDALADGTNFGLSLSESILVSIFVIGLEGLIFALVPIVFLDGHKIARWSKILWGVVFGIAAFAFFHIIINQDGEITEAMHNSNLLMMGGIIGFFFLVSVLLWIYFHVWGRR